MPKYTGSEDCGLEEQHSTPAMPSQAPVKATGSRDHYAGAKAVIEKWGRPVAFHGGKFWSFHPEHGWWGCTSKLFALAAKLTRRNPHNTIMPILSNGLAIPEATGQESTYWENKSSSNFEPDWQPLVVGPDHLVCTDKIVNITTQEEESLARRVVFGTMITLPFDFDADTEPTCPEFDALLLRNFPDPEMRRHFLECMSIGLQPHVGQRFQVVLHGAPYTGKTTLATAIGCCPAGRSGISQMQESELCRDKFASSGLVGKFYNVSDDSAQTAQWVNWWKRYSSGSMVVEVKFHMPETVTPTCKLVSTTNEIQHLVDASGAALDRLVPFLLDKPMRKVMGTPHDEKMRVTYWSNLERRQGVFSTLYRSLVALRTRGCLLEPVAYLAGKAAASTQADPVGAALVELVERDETGFVESSALITGMKATGLDEYKLSRMLPGYMARLFDANKVTRKINGSAMKGYHGVKLTEVTE